MTLSGTIRLVIGAALVAAGVPLVGPLAAKLAAAARATPAAMPQAVPAPGAPVGPQAAAAVPTAIDHATPAAAEGVPAADPWVAQAGFAAPDSAGGLQLDRCPPPPPAPLPATPHELTQASPALGAAYRSTLRVPPPDLLDAAAPPPALPWPAPALPAANGPAPTAFAASPAAVAGDVTVPSTYRIQDGDDLAAIAGRFYGHPAAASAIWAENRATIPNPDLLPIGAELRLPPAWAVGGRRVAGAIEPAAYARPVAVAAPAPSGHARPTWLAPAPELQPAPVPVTPPPSFGAVPAAGSVRVGPGETLVSLARRLYGNPAAADEIFAVNRDRLRSPDLVVAGMELRLPRPVTVPRQ